MHIKAPRYYSSERLSLIRTDDTDAEMNPQFNTGASSFVMTVAATLLKR
ncbi:hypothetical protein T01_5140 [Trichinella spiralis]|uniref:Uncharacterized protein n=1 Tax=Trichinella spiralis TaxID=6334 RepID=A0A0V1BT71_TRISP|nr:hypothetical protein T01_5140 [Trichinella spiralis]